MKTLGGVIRIMKELGKFQSLPTVDSIKKKKDREEVIHLLEEANLLKSDIERKSQRLDEVKDELLQYQQEYELDGVRNGPYCFAATWQEGRRNLSKDALVDNGVDPQVIADSYRQGEGFWKKEVKKLEDE